MSVKKDGFSKERYQRYLRSCGLVPAIKDLTAAAATVVLKEMVPVSWGSITIKAMGGMFQAAGGAQTTAGTVALYINGAVWQDDAATPATISFASVVSHAAGAVVEVSLNATLAADNLTTEPAYPVAVAGDVIELRVLTQGVGAGDQTCVPYILFSETPGQT